MFAIIINNIVLTINRGFIMTKFVHLHNHTEYSLLDGSCKINDSKGNPSELFDIIKNKYKMTALAITDHGNMYGAMEFYWAAKHTGIKPIIGCEVYLAKESRFDKFYKKQTNNKTNDIIKNKNIYNHLTLLSKNLIGYKNLMLIVSIGFIEGFYYKPRIDKETLKKYSEGIIALSGCLAGSIPSALLKEDYETAEREAIEYKNIFGEENFYIELMDNGLKEQQMIIPKLIELSKKTKIPIVATNDCHFLKKEDYEIHDILLCIGTGKTLNDEKRMRFKSDLFYYRSQEEMIKTFSYIPESIKNTLEITEKINLNINSDKLLLPQFQIPKPYKNDSEYLYYLCNQGLINRYNSKYKNYEKRLNNELKIINNMGFASYFLIVYDLIKYAKTNNIPVGPGRGSGAGSIVAYTLGITDICPLKYDLLFERFLNPNRNSMPDLDIDFADSGRDKVIQYAQKKYGEEKCAQIITFGSMQSKLVIRDVARVMGFTQEESNNIVKLIPQNITINETLNVSTELKKIINTNEKIKKLIEISQKLEGIKRHTGIHAAGIVIANEKITNYSPMAKGSKNIITTQYDGAILSKLGLLKIDFLGLKTLTVIDECIKLINKNNKFFNLKNISFNDEKTYQLLSKAKTTGIFQLESKGIKKLIKKLKPNKIDDIIALIALYRPGPMGSGMLDDFVNRKHGKKKIFYDHKLLEPILKDTYGIILYQEQVMKMSIELAGFNGNEADLLRIAMSKKTSEAIENQREKFINGANKKNINKKISEKIFNNIVSFGSYGFNKSHSAAYAIITYQTAYLKANYPLEYFTTLLNSEIGRSSIKDNETSKLAMYLDDLKTLNIKLLHPNVQYSNGNFSIENNSIRYGLLAIKNIGKSFTNSIEQTRNINKKIYKFKNLDDFLQRIDIKSTTKKSLESMIKAGAFDIFGTNKLVTRSNFIENINSFVNMAIKIKKEKESTQEFLFKNLEIIKNPHIFKKTKPFELFQILNFEKEVLGFYISGHPLEQIKKHITMYSTYDINKFKNLYENIQIAGIITSIKKNISKLKKEIYMIFKLENLQGDINVILFSKKLKEFSRYIIQNNIVIVSGKLTTKQEQQEIIANKIISLNDINTSICKTVHIKIPTKIYNVLINKKLKEIFNKYKGYTKIYIDLEDYKYGNFSIETKYLTNCSDNFINDIETAIGLKESVKIII
jgi:DNA polymerase-3 subunit alpha